MNRARLSPFLLCFQLSQGPFLNPAHKEPLCRGTLEPPINKQATLLHHLPIWHMEGWAHSTARSDLTACSRSYFRVQPQPLLHLRSVSRMQPPGSHRSGQSYRNHYRNGKSGPRCRRIKVWAVEGKLPWLFWWIHYYTRAPTSWPRRRRWLMSHIKAGWSLLPL